ncbi:membrane alanyl aminopeptidase [Janibacter hoylei PVAS-1]|uniref:Aminopeptidase N n=1 Tax=Janibacter hoylei PVAS-1 TaxID=1210046 RepID=K1E9B4_9MICO|nr:aminopeptidase N [Janibacter hoylei]EKA62032.1 membrane alanyl aminopeptidase [Janibacter hoylei PVAS-1]RWU82543.1 aminopeptidase N [Janibacter hoylei PVAS-1]
MPSLTRDEAIARADLLSVTRMEVELDLDRGAATFGSVTRIHLTAAADGQTFVDVKPETLHHAQLDGVELDVTSLREGRLPLAVTAGEHVLEVDATMAYSHDGEGLHRATDPADGEDYVFSHLFLDAAPAVFACIDQPDVKAPYAVCVKAPQEWQVIGNGAAQIADGGVWHLAETRPLSTYFVALCAGPYVSVTGEHDGIRLGLWARRSLEEQLREHAPEMLDVTRRSFDYFHSIFGIRYPFDDYDQVFVPEFNAGAMENPGCVVVRDAYLFRGAVGRDELLTRANTISHEMAHMWFGDLVSPKWWDDLWLNESFAEYMAHRCLVEATDYTEAWVDSTMSRKSWGYGAERAPSTHPVAGSPAPDAKSALANFDGISYAKGAAVIRQLIEFIGDEAFLEGIRQYLGDHSFGNGTLADFLGAMEAASGQPLADWSRAWLETAGVDRIEVGRDGSVTRTAPPEHPADRPHAFDIATYTDGAETSRVQLTLDADRATVDGLDTGAELVLPNAGDLTWATPILDGTSLRSLGGQLPRMTDEQARAVLWVGLRDGVALAQVDPRLLVDLGEAALVTETNDSIFARAGMHLTNRVIRVLLPEAEQDAARARMAAVGEQVLADAEPGSSRALHAARLVARTTDDVERRLVPWAEGRDLPAGLEGDADFRWILLGQLSRRGLIGAPEIDAALEQDRTMTGQLGALTARAAIPTAEAKAAAWADLTTNRERSNYELVAIAAGFWGPQDRTLVAPYVSRYFTDIPPMTAWLGEDALSRVASMAYPSRFVSDETLAHSRAALAGELQQGVRRAIVDAQSELEEALASRRAFPPASA